MHLPSVHVRFQKVTKKNRLSTKTNHKIEKQDDTPLPHCTKNEVFR